MPQGLTFAQLVPAWADMDPETLTSVTLIDSFQQNGVMSITLRFAFSSQERTLSKEEDTEVFPMPEDYSNNTITFSMEEVREADMKRILLTVYDALKEKGYNPISQIVGYILSEDPTYITTHNNARSLIRRIDRDELLKAMVRSYLGE